VKIFFKSFQKSFKKYGKKLIFLQHLNKLFNRMENDLSELTMPEIKGKGPCWWWNPENHDKHLLKAIYLYGYTSFHQKLKELDELGFCGEEFDKYREQIYKDLKEKEQTIENDKDKENTDDKKKKPKEIDVNDFPPQSKLNQRAQKLIDKLLVNRRLSY